MKPLLAMLLSNHTCPGLVTYRRVLPLLVAALTVFGAGSARAGDIFAPSKAVTQLQAAAGESASLVSDPATGLIRHLGAGAAPIAATGANSEAKARGFMETYAGAFAAGDLELTTVSVRDGGSSSHVRFAQTVAGIPVTAGAVHVQLNDAGVVNVSANTLAGAPSSLEPSLDAAGATAAAAAVVAKGDYEGSVSYSDPRLEVFDRSLIDRQAASRTRLAWFVEATAPALREYIWVDAADGGILLSYSQLAEAEDRAVYDSDHRAITSATGAVQIWDQAGAITDIAGDDDNNAFTHSRTVYDLFFNYAGWDSFDGAGSTIISNVQFCPNPVSLPCPTYNNAFWDGVQMVFSDDYTDAEDIVGHEFAHGVVDSTAALMYRGEPGAINESFTDIFGELADRDVDNVGEAADVWLIGEDLPSGGPIRNMMTPDAAPFYDAPSTQSSLYYCGNLDNGGVHSNSGVGNRAFALAFDGNGGAITGISGTNPENKREKAVLIWLDALQTLLPASTWSDAYAAINGSCSALVGTVVGPDTITTGDCTQIQLALAAVQMDTAPCVMPTAMACPAGTTRFNIFSDGFEDPASGVWSSRVLSGLDHWSGSTYGTPDIFWADNPRSGNFSAWGIDFAGVGDSAVETATGTPLTLDSRAMFWSDYQFESSMGTPNDGGVVEYSTNGGASWMDAGPLMDGGQTYNGTLPAGNPLGARMAFTGQSGAYVPTTLDLSGLTGQNFKLRFRAGTDAAGSDFGWFVDDVGIFRCVAGVPTDWDGDLYPDIFWNNIATGANRVWTMTDSSRSGVLTLPSFPNTTSRVGAVADFDQNGTPDFVATNTATRQVLLVLMKSTLKVKKAKPLATLPAGYRIAAAGDFDNNGFPDIVVRNAMLGVTLIAYWNGTKFTAVRPVDRSAAGMNLRIDAAGDMDQDGDPDLIWRDYTTGRNYVQFLNNRTTTKVKQILRVADPRAVLEQVSDFNLDGYMDLLWRHYGAGRNQIWYMKGITRTGKVNILREANLDWNIEN